MIRPLNNYIAVKPANHVPSEVLEVVGKDAEEFQRGEIIATGPGKRLKGNKLRPMPVKVGDSVMYRKRSALAWHKPQIGDDFHLITDDDVLGVV